jgi:hypothetical protein
MQNEVRVVAGKWKGERVFCAMERRFYSTRGGAVGGGAHASAP